MSNLIKELEKEYCKTRIPSFQVGDTLKVSTRISESGKERVQVFQGTVISRKGGGISETISLHRVAYGEGMEKSFLLHSPKVVNMEVIKRGKVARAKLYYLRGKTGKAARVRERIVARSEREMLAKEAQEAQRGA
ncbi:50S ribosomal protein L19 [Candidatus Clavichlamydia salmonicola]|uniref:50S ribosomal protein L19 n=1 Tax=Candidatus Clavichlamydia salmonicola TaxID=469812 RepID=UPI001891E7E1|nr:50S ribosomal protein L19 [Candidatus Clavichlamydia salmonicola]